MLFDLKGPVELFDEYAAGYAHKDVGKVIELFSEDAVFKDPRFKPFIGKQDIKSFLTSEYGKIEEYRVEKLFTCVQGEKAAVEWRIEVKIKATGEKVSLDGVTLIETRNGLIQSLREYYYSYEY